MGGKFDKSFNEAAYDGAERWKKETGKTYLDFEIANEAQREQAHAPHGRARRQSDRSASASRRHRRSRRWPRSFPKLSFVIIDSVVKLPNVESIVFKEHEGSFLVGMMAALASKSGKVGFVGGMDIPLIRKFQCGYEQGAKYANPKVEVSVGHDRHHAGGVERPGARRRARQGAVRQGRRRRLRRRRRHRHRRLPGRQGRRQAGDRRRQQPEPPAARHDADLDGQARRRRGLQRSKKTQARRHRARA